MQATSGKGGIMKKAAIILVVIMLTVSLLFIAGCGGGTVEATYVCPSIDLSGKTSGYLGSVVVELEDGKQVDAKCPSKVYYLLAGQGRVKVSLKKTDSEDFEWEVIRKVGAGKQVPQKGPLNIALIDSAKRGDVQEAKSLLDQGAEVNAQNEYGYTPLFLAAREGKALMATTLLNRGADVNMKTRDGLTPLHTACYEGNTEMAELLLNQGADVNARDNDGATPLTWAVKQGHTEVAEFLRQHGGVE
jgi:hypothetical protein